MHRILAALLVALLPLTAAAEPLHSYLADFLTKDKPNELAYYASADDDCPVTKKEVVDTVESVLIRSRIKPIGGDAWVGEKVFLSVSLHCLETDNSVFVINLYFGRKEVLLNHPYGTFGTATKDFMLEPLKGYVELAITDYLQANFDLAPE